ncbi:ABC transporter permease [Nocardioides carbamazepini]|uniref:ABC transporter permease n=1 Tax=Nocardioides carbamazepini TaxID=2854259 RepID=UPI00214A2C76|nr:ABC transporter permease [Nocardioides carbamazepini]MCR1783235.1 ABC transporter permease [Nocardioides carbamazepini]
MRYLVLRAAQLVVVVFGVTVVSFVLLHLLPGDVTTTVLGEGASPEAKAALRAELGLDDPLLSRYWEWLTSAMRGDLGDSLTMGYPVTELIRLRLPVTLELAVVTLSASVLLAIPTALVAARFRNRWQDKVLSMGAYAGIAAPPFLAGILLIYVFSVKLGWLPATGWNPWSEGLVAHVRTLVMPVASLLFVEAAIFMRVLRSDLVAQLSDEEYPLVARAKGATMRSVMIRHVLRNSLLPFVTIVGLQFGVLLGGAVIVEHLFALPGLGELLVSSIYQRDATTVQGIVMFIAIAFVLINALVDLLYRFIDPRVKQHG